MANDYTQTNQMWEHPTIDALADKSASRTGLPPRTQSGNRVFSEVTGFDGGVSGGLRPFHGFRFLHNFHTSLDVGGNWEGTKPAAFSVEDMRGVSFQIEEDSYGYGFVYMVHNSTDDKNHWFIDFWVGSGSTAYTVELTETSAYSATIPWSVVAVGRLVYLFVRGNKPTLLYVTDKTDPANTVVRVGGAHESSTVGPGTQPGLQDAGVGSAPTPPALTAAALTLVASTSGKGDDQVAADLHKIDPGGYKFAYQFSDSNTGRRSPLSEIAVANTEDFPSSGADAAYARIQGTWDTSEWDTIRLYRSIRKESAGSDYGSAYMHLDSVYTLTDLETGTPSGTVKGFEFIFEADDNVLARQEAWLDADAFEEEIPAAGEAIIYENALLLTDILPKSGDDTDEKDGRGETRYSSLTEASYELFRPGSRVVPKTPDQRFIRFLDLGEGLLGFGYANLGHFHREGYFFRSSRRIHKGQGLVHARAAAESAEQGYYVNDRGVKVVHSNGALEDLTRLNYLIQSRWQSSLSSCRMAYDAQLGAMFLLNSEEKAAEVMWMNTGRITSLEDAEFTTVEHGWWPANPDDLTTELRERAFFLHKSQQGVSAPFARVYVTDIQRAKHSTAIRFMDLGAGDSFFTVTAVGGGGTITVSGSPSWPTRSIGARIYVSQPGDSDNSRIGNNARIVSTASGGFVVAVADASKFAVGDRVVLCPTVQRIVTTPVLPESEDGYRFTAADYFRQKQIKGVGASFTSVSGAAADSTDAVFVGLLFKDDRDVPYVKAIPADPNEDVVVSVKEGAVEYRAGFRSPSATEGLRGSFGVSGAALAFGIEILAANIEYNLVSILATGSLKESSRTERPT